MKRILKRASRPTGAQILITAAFAAAALLLDSTSFVRSLDRRFESRVLHPLVTSKIQRAPFLLVAVDSPLVDSWGCPPFSGERLFEVEQNLMRLGIDSVVLPIGDRVWLPNPADDAPISSAVEYLVPTVLERDAYSRARAMSRPRPAPNVVPIPAVSIVELDADGSARAMPRRPANTAHMDILAYWLAKRGNPRAREPIPQEPIRLFDSDGRIPALPLSRIIAGDYSRIDAAGRQAVLGVTSGLCSGTPIKLGGELMSRAELHIHSALTLLTPALLPMAPAARIPYIAFVALLVMFGFSRVRVGRRVPALAVTISAGAALALVSAYFLETSLPMTAPLSAVLGAYVYYSVHQTGILLREIRANNASLRSEIERWVRSGSGAAHEPAKSSFELLVSYLKDYVPVQGAYLFLLPLSAFHYRLHLSLDLDETDIQERRRDIRRMPWLGALSSPNGAYLDRFMKDDDRHAYGIPLFDYGAVLGMVVLVFDVRAELPERTRRFLRRCGEFMSGALIAARTDDRDNRLFASLMRTLMGQDALYGELSNTQAITGGVRTQLDRYRQILNKISVGIMVSDLLGNIYYLNRTALDFLARTGIDFNKRLPDFFGSLMPQDPSLVQQIMEAAVLGESIPPLEWSSRGGETTFQITASGICLDSGDDPLDDKRISAIVVTIGDVSVNRQLDRLKSQVLALASSKGKSLVDIARNTVMPPPIAGIPSMPPSGPAVEETWGQLYGLFEQFLRLSERMDHTPSRQLETPYDALMTVKEIVRDLSDEAEKRGIGLELETPELITPAFGDWRSFKRGFQSLVSDSIRTCLRGHSIIIRVRENGRNIQVMVTDPSSTPNEELVSAVDTNQWGDVPLALSEGLRSFSSGNIPFKISATKSGGTMFSILLNKL